MNKAQIQFNWIFITIAGALILAFFFGFALKYQGLQEEKLAIELLTTLDSSLTGFQASSYKTIDTISTPKNIEINCSNIIIDEKKYETNNLIFSPNKLKNKIYVWYQPYDLPFKITNFYYIIDENQKFNLVSSSQFINEVKEQMPEQFKDKVEINSQEPNRIVFSQNSNINEGIITIRGDSYSYVGLPQLYAIIFSEDYGCLEDKIDLEIKDVIEVYERKALLLTGRAGNCNYNGISQKLSELKQNPSYSTSQLIEDLNQDLAERNCPTLF